MSLGFQIALTLLGSLITSFIGSFFCFVVWIHFDLDERWRLRSIKKGHKLENQWRAEQGLPELPELEPPASK